MIIRQIILLIMRSSILVGGQAVINGVMMRVPGAYGTAVRDSEGNIQFDRHDFQSILDKKPALKKPIIRGMIGLFESLTIGYSTLQWSAQIVEPDTPPENTGKLADILLTLLSIGLVIGLFFAAPMGLTSWLFDKDKDALFFNLISGLFRVTFFIIYLILISLMKDVKRLFQYHGAEHKTVYNFESGKELKIEIAQTFSTLHPRCGTSFMFIIMIVAILSFSVLDSFILLWVEKLNVWMRLLIHLPFIPVVAGLGYEVLKATAKHRHNFLFLALSKPGLWLQNITTRQPSNDQVEVAMEALKSAFGEKIHHYSGKSYVAEAIG